MNIILALDQGTTSCRAIAFDHDATIMSSAQREFTQFFPETGHVEHDAEEIWRVQSAVAAEVIANLGTRNAQIAAIGITNQRETTVLWNRATGVPIAPAIVWQDRRTTNMCNALAEAGYTKMICDKTGLIIDAYFSATKLKWLLDHVPNARECAERGELAFGTMDSWLIFKLTQGKVHATDVSNASRTMLFNIRTLAWDDDLLKLMDIPRSVLPKIVSSSGFIGETACPELPPGIPITGVAGDQQAALFGQACHQPGMAKNTYGTGCFMLMNTGETPHLATVSSGLLTTIAWRLQDQPAVYALEGSVFIAGAAVQWLRDGLGIIAASGDVEALAAAVPDTGGVVFVPAFAGLGTPYWDSSARGAIVGLTRSTTKAHIARATLEAIAFQSAEVLNTMQEHAGIALRELRVDGGATVNHLLMQTQADALGVKVIRPRVTETTALGSAYLAGLAIGFWSDQNEIASRWALDAVFEPLINREAAAAKLTQWQLAVERSRGWVTT